jgi:hypothetical protein
MACSIDLQIAAGSQLFNFNHLRPALKSLGCDALVPPSLAENDPSAFGRPTTINARLFERLVRQLRNLPVVDAPQG